MTFTTSDGDLTVNVHATLTGAAGLDASTSDGDIAIELPRDLDADLDLRADEVNLKGNIAIQGNVSRHHVRGAIGRGGPGITASSTDGSITLASR